MNVYDCRTWPLQKRCFRKINVLSRTGRVLDTFNRSHQINPSWRQPWEINRLFVECSITKAFRLVDNCFALISNLLEEIRTLVKRFIYALEPTLKLITYYNMLLQYWLWFVYMRVFKNWCGFFRKVNTSPWNVVYFTFFFGIVSKSKWWE